MIQKAAPREEEHRTNHSNAVVGEASFKTISLALLTILFLVLVVLLCAPFLPAISWALALAILGWPLHRYIAWKVQNRSVAAALSVAVLGSAILAAGVFVTYQITSKAADAAENAETQTEFTAESLRGRLANVPVIGRALDWIDRTGVDVTSTVSDAIQASLGSLSDIAGGSLWGGIQFLLMLFILYYLFRDRDEFVGGLQGVLPMSADESRFLMERVSDSIHATLYATFVTSFIDAVAFGFVFWAAGLPLAMLWTIILFALSILPILGAGMVWVPAAVYLGVSGQWIWAAVVLVVGGITATFVDNILYAKLVGGRMRTHDVPVMIAFLGGIAVFGASGMILGPAILATAEALLKLWRVRLMPPTRATGDGRPDPAMAGGAARSPVAS